MNKKLVLELTVKDGETCGNVRKIDGLTSHGHYSVLFNGLDGSNNFHGMGYRHHQLHDAVERIRSGLKSGFIKIHHYLGHDLAYAIVKK